MGKDTTYPGTFNPNHLPWKFEDEEKNKKQNKAQLIC